MQEDSFHCIIEMRKYGCYGLVELQLHTILFYHASGLHRLSVGNHNTRAYTFFLWWPQYLIESLLSCRQNCFNIIQYTYILHTIGRWKHGGHACMETMMILMHRMVPQVSAPDNVSKKNQLQLPTLISTAQLATHTSQTLSLINSCVMDRM